MEGKEEIDVFIRYENGKTACICLRKRRKCNCKTCEKETVERDKYKGWQEAFRQDRYGHSHL